MLDYKQKEINRKLPEKKNVSKSVFKSAATALFFPIVMPIRWLKNDTKNVLDNAKTQYQGIYDRNFKNAVNESASQDKKINEKPRLENMENEQILINLAAITNRWKMFVIAYSVSMISVIWGIISFNPLIFFATSAWMVFFWANASRLAWAFARQDKALHGDSDGISFRDWLRINWMDNLPLPPKLKKFHDE